MWTTQEVCRFVTCRCKVQICMASGKWSSLSGTPTYVLSGCRWPRTCSWNADLWYFKDTASHCRRLWFSTTQCILQMQSSQSPPHYVAFCIAPYEFVNPCNFYKHIYEHTHLQAIMLHSVYAQNVWQWHSTKYNPLVSLKHKPNSVFVS